MSSGRRESAMRSSWCPAAGLIRLSASEGGVLHRASLLAAPAPAKWAGRELGHADVERDGGSEAELLGRKFRRRQHVTDVRGAPTVRRGRRSSSGNGRSENATELEHGVGLTARDV